MILCHQKSGTSHPKQLWPFAFLYCLRILCRIKWLKLDRQDWRPDKKLILLQCWLGIPLALQNVLIAIGGMVLQSAINRQGFLFIAGFTATNKIYGLLESSAIKGWVTPLFRFCPALWSFRQEFQWPCSFLKYGVHRQYFWQNLLRGLPRH